MTMLYSNLARRLTFSPHSLDQTLSIHGVEVLVFVRYSSYVYLETFVSLIDDNNKFPVVLGGNLRYTTLWFLSTLENSLLDDFQLETAWMDRVFHRHGLVVQRSLVGSVA